MKVFIFCMTYYMRLWSLHPRYLDVKGLLAAWREGLLAQKVLEGLTKGYTRHPQLERFRAATDPAAAIARYLSALADEADARGYRFDRSKIHAPPSRKKIPVTTGQISYELSLLESKLSLRDPERLSDGVWLEVRSAVPLPVSLIRLNPLFHPGPGDIEAWERIRNDIPPKKIV
jgi:hypothetical protein